MPGSASFGLMSRALHRPCDGSSFRAQAVRWIRVQPGLARGGAVLLSRYRSRAEEFWQLREVVVCRTEGEYHADPLSPSGQMLPIGPISLLQPKISSLRLRIVWLIASPGWRVVRPSMAERRPAVLQATCGVTAMARGSFTKSAAS